MSVATWFDRAIRRSLIGSHLSRLRAGSPRAYAFLRAVYARVFPIKSSNELARYQVRAVKVLSIVPRQYLRLPVLEVGSDLDAKVIKEFKASGVDTVIGINPAFHVEDLKEIAAELPVGCELRSTDIRNTGISDNSIGAIFSVSVFEHLTEFGLCLMEMHRILAPGGYVYAEFGPIWSSRLGHHVFANYESESARHWDPQLNPVRDYSHLLLSPEEMRADLSESTSEGLRKEIVSWIYDSPHINRLFFENYISEIAASPFEILSIEVDKEKVESGMLNLLREKYPSYSVFDVRNVEVILRKPGLGDKVPSCA